MSAGPKTSGTRPPEQLAAVLGVEIPADDLRLALIHRSFAFEAGGIEHNERLEFLGDSVLGIVITDRLYRSYPDLPEGQLARMRSAVVNAQALAGVGRQIGLGEFLYLGKGEEATNGRDKASILADTTEAVIGAVYLHAGLDVAASLIRRLFDPLVDAAYQLGAGLDWKSSLQELAAQQDAGVPAYETTESGPDHEKRFAAAVRIGDSIRGRGDGKTKKAAEQLAAKEAYESLSSAAGA